MNRNREVQQKNRKSFIWLISILSTCLLLFAAGCGQMPVSDSDDPTTGSGEGEEKEYASLETELDIVQSEDGTVSFDLIVKNNGEQDVKLDFSSSQTFELTVRDSEGKDIYKYSIDKMFLQALTSVEIKAGEKLAWSEELDFAAQGVQPQGEVTVVAEVLATSEANGLELDKDQLVASTTIELKAMEQNSGNNDVDQDAPDSGVSTPEGKTNKEWANEAFRNIYVAGENGKYTITGEARVHEANVQYAVTEGHFYYLEDEFTTASTAAPDWGTFTIEIDISDQEFPVNGTVLLELFEESMKDGSMLHTLVIPLESFN